MFLEGAVTAPLCRAGQNLRISHLFSLLTGDTGRMTGPRPQPERNSVSNTHRPWIADCVLLFAIGAMCGF